MISFTLGELTVEQMKDVMEIRKTGMMSDEELQKLIDKEAEKNRSRKVNK